MGLVPIFDPGERVGDLRIERELGSGAFGRVYLAHDVLIGRDVALKVLGEGAGEQADQRALREARAIGRLSHPHIAALYRVSEPGPHRVWLFEMEYLPGGSLADRIRAGEHFEPAAVREIAKAVGSALAHAHERGVVHGDVKPSNVLLADDGRLKLVDFGLARFMGDVSMRLSESERVGGTPLYMAPETVMGEAATPRSDVWSLGVLLYRLLAGRAPFGGRGVGGLFHSILNEEPDPLPSSTGYGLAPLVHQCLRKDPAQRPASGGEVVRIAGGKGETVAVPQAADPTSIRARYGQERQVGELEPVVQGFLGGRGRCVVVTGETGAGKSTLLRTMRTRCRARGVRWIESAVSPLHGFQRPFLAALQDALGIPEETATVLDVSASTARMVRALYGGEPEPPLKSSAESYWAIERILVALARGGPLAVAIEDVHAATDEDVRLLHHLAHYLSREGVLLFLTCRTDMSERRVGALLEELLSVSETVQVEIGALRDADLLALIESRYRTARIDPVVLRRLVRLSQGNPLVCNELIRHLRESGATIEKDGQVSPGPTWETAPLPRRMRELASARLATLPESERHLLDVAAVDGFEFDGEALAAVTGDSLLAVMRSLERIRRERGLVRPTATGYQFAGSTLHEAIYASLSPPMRRALHRSLAEHLESRRGRIAPLRIGTHWEESGEHERAVPYLRAAMAEFLGRFELTRGLALRERAGLGLDQLTPDTLETESELLLDTATALRSAGRPDEAIETLRRVAEAARSRGDRTTEMRALVRLQLVRFYHRGRDAVDVESLRRAVEELAPEPECVLAAQVLGIIAKFDQRYDDALAHFAAAEKRSRELGLDSLLATTLHERAGVALRCGRLREAEALYHDSARIAELAGNRANAATSRVNAVISAYGRGELGGLAESLQDAIHLMSFAGSPNLAGQTRIVLGQLLWSEGRADGALQATRDGLAILERTQHLQGLTTGLRLESEIVGCRGELAGAWDLYRRAAALLERVGNRRIQNMIHALAMRYELWAGRIDRAEGHLEPCLGQLASDRSEAARISIDLVDGILFGLSPEASERVRRAIESAEAETPELEAARRYCRFTIAWRAGGPPAGGRELEEFLSLPLAYRRAQVHAAAMFLAGRSDRALEDARRIGHAWLELLVLRARAAAGAEGDVEGYVSALDRVESSAGAALDPAAFTAAWQL